MGWGLGGLGSGWGSGRAAGSRPVPAALSSLMGLTNGSSRALAVKGAARMAGAEGGRWRATIIIELLESLTNCEVRAGGPGRTGAGRGVRAEGRGSARQAARVGEGLAGRDWGGSRSPGGREEKDGSRYLRGSCRQLQIGATCPQSALSVSNCSNPGLTRWISGSKSQSAQRLGLGGAAETANFVAVRACFRAPVSLIAGWLALDRRTSPPPPPCPPRDSAIVPYSGSGRPGPYLRVVPSSADEPPRSGSTLPD